MFHKLLPALIVCSTLFGTHAGCSRAVDPDDRTMLPSKYRKLLPLHAKLGRPRPGDWLDQHKEPGQTFRQYVGGRPVRPTKERGVIYVQPLGDFNRTQRKVIDLTAEFMGIYFDLPVKTNKDLSLSLIPDKARRKHPSWGMDQVLSTYVLYDVLRPRLPRDACTCVAFTTSDLWPGEGWNFVFGQASLRGRVGVWSIYRMGDPSESEEAFKLCLRRTIKIGTHETGHMFSMFHCTLFECNMCGCNHQAEADSRPLALCPNCLAKLLYATGARPEKRFRKLIEFCKKNGLDEEREFYEKSLEAIK